MAETPHLAHLVVLVFLGSGFVTAVCLITALVATVSKAPRVAKFAAAGAALVAFSYVALLFGVAMISPNKTLRVGGWKYFCEADCHIAYSIADVKHAVTLGPETRPMTAHGQFAVVRLKTWFDEHSIAPWRGDAPLTPSQRSVEILDEAGHRYAPLTKAMDAVGASSTLTSQPLRPGESYETTLVFDLPSGVHGAKLLIADEDPVSRVLVDHENSPLHGKIYLALDGALPVAASTQQ